MLKTLRNKTSGFAAKLILGLVVVAFVATGFAGFFQGTPSSMVVAAGRSQLGIDDYRLAWRQAEVSIAQRLGHRPSHEEARANGIETQVMSQLVTEAALDEQARRLDLGLSQDRLARLIADDPSFHDAAGNFSRGNFRELLSSVGMTENDFIRNRQQASIRSQIIDAVARGASTPTAVRTAFGLYSGERRTVEYLTLPTALVEPVAEPSADALAQYFDKNKQRYRAPEYRGVDTIMLTPDALANPAAVTDDDIVKDYETGRQRYTSPERRQVQQLIFADKAAADSAKSQLANGSATFEQLATVSGRTLADADLGLREKSGIPDKSIADAAFALPVDRISDVVNGAFGSLLLRVTKIEPESVKPLDQVRDQIRRELALQAAGEQLNQAQNAFDDARAGGATLQEAAQRSGLTVKTVPAVSRSGQTPDEKPAKGLPATDGFLEGVFTAEVGAENPAINLEPSGSLLYEVTKIDPARDRSLDEVRARVVEDWKSDEAQRLLGERAKALKKRLDGGEQLDQIAVTDKLGKDTAQAVTRESGVGQLGGEGVRKAFGGPNGFTAVAVGPDGGSRLLLKVSSVAPPLDPMKSLSGADAQRLDQLIQNDLLQTYVDGLRKDYQVVSYPQAMERAQADLR